MLDINADMIAAAATRAGDRSRAAFIQGNAETLPLRDYSYDAVSIAFGIRNVPNIAAALAEAYRVLRIGGRFLCLEFSSADLPGLDALYDFYSFRVIPALGRAVTGDAQAYRYLVESIRRFPTPAGICPDDAGRRVLAGLLSTDDRRDRHPAFRLAVVIAAVIHLCRLARGGFVFSREGVLALIETSRLPLSARAAIGLARLIERPSAGVGPNRLARALTRLGPSYVKLGQFLGTRPDIVGAALARDLESLQDKMTPFPQQAAVQQLRLHSANRCTQRLRCLAVLSQPRPSHRCIAPKLRWPMVRAQSRSRCSDQA